MKDLSNYAEQMAAACSEAIALHNKLAPELARLIPDATPDDRHALLALRTEIEAAVPELSAASSRASTIANKLAALEGDNTSL